MRTKDIIKTISQEDRDKICDNCDQCDQCKYAYEKRKPYSKCEQVFKEIFEELEEMIRNER